MQGKPMATSRVRRPVVCIISPTTFTDSEAFVQAHLRRLPAKVLRPLS